MAAISKTDNFFFKNSPTVTIFLLTRLFLGFKKTFFKDWINRRNDCIFTQIFLLEFIARKTKDITYDFCGDRVRGKSEK